MLTSLESDPMNVRMQLRPALVNNAAWTLAENDIFKQHVDQNLSKELTRLYQKQGVLQALVSSAMEKMHELNVTAPLHLAGVAEHWEEEDWREFSSAQKQGWVPIFQEWIGMERECLKSIDTVLPLLEE